MTAANPGLDPATTTVSTASGTVWVIDLDGVVWLTGEAIGDPSRAVSQLRDRGIRVVFATNNSAPTHALLLERLHQVGIEAAPSDLLTSADAAGSLLPSGSRAHVLAEDGVLEALSERGVAVAESGPVDAVVVGWSHAFDFDRLAAAAAAARVCGLLIGTNEDPTHPTPDGLQPGSGALLAAVATASGVTPVVAGKPHEPMIDLLRARCGSAGEPVRMVLVGDQPRTDGRMAQQMGVPFALVDTGVTAPGVRADGVHVAVRAPSLNALVDGLLAGSKHSR